MLYSIWQSFENISDFQTPLIGVLSIIIAALTIVTPVFHRLSGQKAEDEEIDEEIACLRTRIEELELKKAEIQLQSSVE